MDGYTECTMQVIVECNERVDDFIFQTIDSYGSYMTEMVISKDLMLDALKEYKKNHPERFKIQKKDPCDIDKKVSEIVSEYHCCDSNKEYCHNNCAVCQAELKNSLMELVTMVQKTEREKNVIQDNR